MTDPTTETFGRQARPYIAIQTIRLISIKEERLRKSEGVGEAVLDQTVLIIEHWLGQSPRPIPNLRSCCPAENQKGVEPTGFEPVTSSMPLRRSTN